MFKMIHKPQNSNIWFNWLRKMVALFIFCFTIYGVLCTVYSDVIVQNEDRFFNLPYKSLSKKKIEKKLEDLIKEETTEKSKNGESNTVPRKNLYIFVLDISASYLNGVLPRRLSEEYRKRMEMVNEKINNRINARENPSIFDFSKLRLYELLVDFYENINTYKNDDFAIWTVGNSGRWLFPRGPKKMISHESIMDAIDSIYMCSEIPTENTDFVSLFRALQFHYKDELKEKASNEYTPPSFFVTFLTDLLHDVDNRRILEIDRSWKELEDLVQQICNSRIMINMIISSDTDLDNHRAIFSIFEDNIEWYRLNKQLIGDEKKGDFLYPVMVTKESIEFYHVNPDSVTDATFSIRSTAENENKIMISLPLEVERAQAPPISLYCEVLDAGGIPLNRGKKVFSGGGYFTDSLLHNQQIRLTYSGRLPSKLTAPILRFSTSNENRTFLIPIKFIKTLPSWASKGFIFIQFLSIITFLLILIFGIFFFTSKSNEMKVNNSIVRESNATQPSP